MIPAIEARAKFRRSVGYAPIQITAVAEIASASARDGEVESSRPLLGSLMYFTMMTRRYGDRRMR